MSDKPENKQGVASGAEAGRAARSDRESTDGAARASANAADESRSRFGLPDNLRPTLAATHGSPIVKRLFDLTAVLAGLWLIWPLLVLIALWVKLDSPGPVFFRQVRVGRGGQLFRIHKFRTMQINAEAAGQLTVGADARVTRAGRLLRKTKLDELPQLLDVLFGDMSLVGPRPEVPKYVALYPARVKEVVLSVRPGITDWASIRMIDENELLGKAADAEKMYIESILPQKLDYYLQYARSYTLWGDVQIILATLLKIVSR
ncbi:sugar transferase [Vogesella indigofera]|uniref:Sugar transferase n=1 Tax=Vogesella indigofera TaxID=45465 RepID=A0ABT5I6R5_VOGIN|nr:sugar transferase [Vogesella indigofera]MDC7691866.1 sugar transferase [Vogesella indigofera]